MPHQHTVTIYDAEDIEKLDDMTAAEVIETLEDIKRGWLPQDYICLVSAHKPYTEDQYNTPRLHKAMTKAIELLEKMESEVKGS